MRRFLAVAVGFVFAGCSRPPPPREQPPPTATAPQAPPRAQKHVVTRKLGAIEIAKVEWLEVIVPTATDHAAALSERLRLAAVAEADRFLATYRDALRDGDASLSMPPWTLDIGVSAPHLSSELVVVRFDESDYLGGAHPNHHVGAATYALGSDGYRAVPFDAAFRPGAAERLDPKIMAALRRDHAGWVEDGSLTSVTKMLHTWYPTRAGLVFVFDPYEAGPYAEGPHEVTLPWSVAGPEVAAGGPLSPFLAP